MAVPLEHAIAINSMLINDRPIAEVFAIAKLCKILYKKPIFADLRSKRPKHTDPESIWSFAHENSSFDISNLQSIEEAKKQAKKHHIYIFALSVYCGASYVQDYEYGIKAITNAANLCEVAPNRTIVLRVFGGNILTSQNKKRAVATLVAWIKHANKQRNSTGNNVVLGIEIHQGQWPQTLTQAIDLKNILRRTLSDDLYAHFGIIEDATNRYIAQTNIGDEWLLPQLADKIIYHHIKNVRRIKESPKEKGKNFQKIGEHTFTFKNSLFQWKLPGQGDVPLPQQIKDAILHSNPPNRILCFSTEHVPSTKTKQEANLIAMTYCKEIYKAIDKCIATSKKGTKQSKKVGIIKSSIRV